MSSSEFREAKELVLAIDKERSDVTLEIQRMMNELGDIGLDGKLLDDEGFPRDDIDVYTIRHLRNRVICRTNDLKALDSRLEKALLNLHSLTPVAAPPSLKSTVSSAHTPPYALVDAVTPGSAAALDGLLVGDRIVSFGTIQQTPSGVISSVDLLIATSKEIQSHENITIPVVVLRRNDVGEEVLVSLRVTPRKVPTLPGLLGCHIVEC